MSKISLEQFIRNTQGTRVDVPWVSSPSNLKGQCVSLIQAYIQDCLEQPAKARGNAVTWRTSYVNEGLGTIATELQKGDILVFPNEAGGYGHLAIYVGNNTIYDQNNNSHDGGAAGYCNLWTNDYVILRPNSELVEDVVVPEPIPEPEPVQPGLSNAELLELTKRTIRGDFGNGQARKDSLGANYARVQEQVNANLSNGLNRWDNIRLF